MSIEMQLSGFLFYCIIVTNIASNRFGYQTTSDLDSEAKLHEINNNPRQFKIGFTLILIEHVCIILLATMLFITFNQYSLILGTVWVVFRGGEGLIQIFNKRNYWGLLNIAKQYPGTNDTEKNSLDDLRLSILKSKQSNFAFAQILFSIGTLAYSIMFVTSGVVPPIVGWFGIVASILYGFSNGIFFVKLNFEALWNLGGLLILLFEIVLGGWLLFFS